jgi:elongation factor 2
VTLAIEPKSPQDIPKVLEELTKLAGEDPNLKVTVDRETGENLLSGMGELHLEVAINQLKSACGLKVEVSSPRVVYMESVQKRGIVALSKSPNKLCSFWVQVEPQDEENNKKPEENADELGSVLSVDERRNVLLDISGKTAQLPEDVLEDIIAGFEFTCRAGPLCGEPMRHAKVNLVDFQLGSVEATGAVEVMRGVGKAVFASFLSADPVLLEPVYKTIITVASELSGECSRILSSRRGKVTSFQQKGLSAVITGFIPVSETFGFSKELRSATSGRAFWQSIFDHWEKMPKKLAQQVISDMRKRKGLSSEVPLPEKFLEK